MKLNPAGVFLFGFFFIIMFCYCTAHAKSPNRPSDTCYRGVQRPSTDTRRILTGLLTTSSVSLNETTFVLNMWTENPFAARI